MSEILPDLKGLLDQLRKLNQDASEEMSSTVGKVSAGVRESVIAIEHKIAEVVRQRLAARDKIGGSSDDGL